MNVRLPLSVCLVLMLAACTTVGPDYHLPEQAKINAPGAQQAFQGAGQGTNAEDVPDDWWHLYDDQQLNALIKDALAANTNIRIAAANLVRSEALAMEAEGAGEVKAGASVAISRAQVSGESFLLEHSVPIFNLGDAGIRAGYQIDLVGGIKRAVEAASAEVDASRAALDLVRINIVADTVLSYMDTCAAGSELEIAQHQLELQQQQQAAIARLVAGGRRMAVDIPRAKNQVEQLRATLPAYSARRRIALYKLAVLTGHPPGEYPLSVENCKRLPELKQQIPVGDGAALLRRRPDVRQAERTLASATARIGVATAALYPSITLGFSDGATGILEHLGQAPTRRWGLGPLISWTLPGEEEKARVRQADANAAAALGRFDTVVLNALQEVESALAILARDLDRDAALRQARDQAAEARRQVQTLYRAGRLAYLDDLDAQRSLTAAETALAASRAQVATDQIKLFLALGGGWQSAAKEATK
ncbi:MAG: efflux transporter outer membrane subunit [Betaproteobacteria bacterium]|nr:efflux transporter outer membrane subunit [Betaproteobacteria bacterium]